MGSTKMEGSRAERLTPKQITFCEEYLKDLNALQAAIRAGYSPKTAGAMGHENLNKPKIQEYIEAQKAERSKRLEISADDILKELAKIGFSDIADYVNTDYKLKPLNEIGEKSGAISSLMIDEFTSPTGVMTKSIKFKLHDKLRALENIAKHIGFYEKDNTQKSIYNVVEIHKAISNELDNDINNLGT